MEFNGCFYHQCTVCGGKNNPENEERFNRKRQYAERKGVFIVERECTWKEDYCETQFPRIMKKFEDLETLLPNILNDTLYGFIVCDVTAPTGFNHKFYTHVTFRF